MLWYRSIERIVDKRYRDCSCRTPDTRVIGGMSSWGPYINDTYILEEKLDFRLQIDYEI